LGGIAVFLLGFSLAAFATPVSVADDRGVVVAFDKPIF
jgi:hypothetical protein